MKWHINHTSTTTYSWDGRGIDKERTFADEDLISLHVTDDDGRDERVLPLTPDEFHDLVNDYDPDSAVARYLAAHPDYCSASLKVLWSDCPMRNAVGKVTAIEADAAGLSVRSTFPSNCSACGALWMNYVSYTPSLTRTNNGAET